MSITPLDLLHEAVALGHVRRADKSAGKQAVGVTCKAVRSTDLAPLSDERKYSCKTRRPIPKIPAALPQQSCLARCIGSNTATKRKLEEERKVRWVKYQQQTRALADDSKLSVAARATWAPGLRAKENLTRAGSTIATLLRTEHIGLHDYLFRRRVSLYFKTQPRLWHGWPRQTSRNSILFYPTHSRRRAEMLAKAKTIDHTKLLSTEAELRAVTRWFLQWDVLTQLLLARTVNDVKPRRKE